jgi:hypothetical protein
MENPESINSINMSEEPIAYCSIFPKLGISRVGNSDEWFVGPESPGVPADPPGGYKDEAGRVKRQGARFRVYGFDAEGKVVREITVKHGDTISWRVALANKKADWYEFEGAAHALAIFEGKAADATLRNADWPGDRRELVIKSCAEVSGLNQKSAPLEGAIFNLTEPVYLGEMLTDEVGRLVVLGGRGLSEPISPSDDAYLLDHYANNNCWHDDVSDGPVEAAVKLADGTEVLVRGRAWVVVTPPDFAPHTQNITTLYDVMEEVALEEGLDWHLAAPCPPVIQTKVSFVEDIYPILARISSYSWVNQMALRGHGPGKPGYFLADDVLGRLANPNDANGAGYRQKFLNYLRNPHLTGDDAVKQANYSFMPLLGGDEGDPQTGKPDTWFKVTKRQYDAVKLWADGQFDGFVFFDKLQEALKAAQPKRLEDLPVAQQPFALTKGALLACVGAPFYPGIEMTAISRSKLIYKAAFELSDKLEAGDVTKWMALPWQADFYECSDHWWPAQRPDMVVSEYDFDDVLKEFSKNATVDDIYSLLLPRMAWDRGVELGRPNMPSFDLPNPNDNESVADYAKRAKAAYLDFTTRNWTSKDDGWLVPQTKNDETIPRYQFRAGEYFDRYSGKNGYTGEKWHFDMPLATSEQTTKQYRDSVIRSFQDFIAKLFPAPSPDETLAEYVARISDTSSTMQQFVASTMQRGFEIRQRYLGDNNMVKMWHAFGFVVPASETYQGVLVEKQRPRYEGLKDREYFYMMLNYNEFPGLEKKARQLAQKFLADARPLTKTKAFLSTPDNRMYQFFDYTPAAFEARMQQIYNRYAAEAAMPEPVWRKQDVLLRIQQLAPFNQLDGAWLRYATDAGPIADVNSFLFDIWNDETGGGNPALNHANLYTTLLQSQGFYLPEINSKEYANYPVLFDSAYTASLFELVISQFSKDFFPEILGMTLQLEWEVLTLWPGVKRLEANGISAQFYRMHIGIDNADDGHGAKAKKAVQQYLDHIREKGGSDEVQKEWQRIWNGYVAFSSTGHVGDDIEIARQYPRLIEDLMVDLINRKKPFGQLNHGNNNVPRLGANRLNDWFEDPNGFLDELAKSSYITPGDPDGSYLLNDRISYHGPMYKIFTPDEIKVWGDWVRWLGKSAGPRESEPQDPASLMIQLIQQVKSMADNVPAHQAKMMTVVIQGRPVSKSLAELFDEDSAVLLAALADPTNGVFVKGNSATSPFFTAILPGAPGMAAVLNGLTFNGVNGVTIISNWVDAGCPTSAPKIQVLRKLEVTSAKPGAQVRFQALLRRNTIFGIDEVH